MFIEISNPDAGVEVVFHHANVMDNGINNVFATDAGLTPFIPLPGFNYT